MADLDNIPPIQLEKEVIEWTDAVYEEAERELVEAHETKLTGKLIDYIEGKQWSSRVRYGRSRPVINRIFRQFIEMVGLLTDLELDFKVKFYDEIEGFSELQKMVNQMIVDWAYDYDFEMELSQVVMWGLIHTGPVKIQWNPMLNNGLGDVEFMPLSPLNFMSVGAMNKVQQAEVCIIRQPVTIEELVRKHGKIAESVVPSPGLSEYQGEVLRPARISKQSWTSYSPSLRRLLGQAQPGVRSKFPKVMRKEFWFRDQTRLAGSTSIIVGPTRDGQPLANWCYRVEPGELIFPRGRVVVTAGGKVLEDQCSPYWHGRLPFALYRAFRVPWKYFGLSPLEPLAAMQSILNRIYGGVMDTVIASIEPSIIGPKNAMSQQDWDTMDPGQPGGKIVYNNNAARAPEFKQPPKLENYVLQFKNDVEKEMDQTSGSSAIQQALTKKQVPGGDSLDMIFNARSVNIRFMGRGMKSFLNEAGSLVVADMLQFYDARHRVIKYGMKGILPHDMVPFYGHMLPQGMQPEEFVRKATFSIRRGSLLGIEKAEEVAGAFALRKMGDLSRRGLYRKLDQNVDVPQIEQELKEEMAEKAAIAAAAGKLAEHGKKK